MGLEMRPPGRVVSSRGADAPTASRSGQHLGTRTSLRVIMDRSKCG